MLTRAGFVVLVVSLVVLAGARAFGLPELFVLGAGGLALLAGAFAYVVIRRLQVEVSRRLTPPRVHAGDPCRVDLTLRNRSRLRSPVLRLRDDVSGTRGVELMVAPMATGAGSKAVYRLPTDRRGIVRVGPLRLTVMDPFGLARITTVGDQDMSLVVYPRVDELGAVRRSSGSDIERLTVQQQRVAPLGEEFHALREYQVGDDLRRIHWPSSARHDDLMVRQDELPWHGRVTVLLDTRPVDADDGVPLPDGTVGRDPATTFEAMVSAAASVAAASLARGDRVRLLCTGGVDSGFGAGRHHLGRILADLAVVERSDHPPATVLERMIGPGSGGALVSVTTGDDEFDDAMFRSAAGVYGRRVLVMFRDDGAIPSATDGALRSTVVIPVPSGAAFAEAWQQAMNTPGRFGL
ncbi:MAG: DUF58 domain-containing protein [Acidimicrobiales bacterium]